MSYGSTGEVEKVVCSRHCEFFLQEDTERQACLLLSCNPADHFLSMQYSTWGLPCSHYALLTLYTTSWSTASCTHSSTSGPANFSHHGCDPLLIAPSSPSLYHQRAVDTWPSTTGSIHQTTWTQARQVSSSPTPHSSYLNYGSSAYSGSSSSRGPSSSNSRMQEAQLPSAARDRWTLEPLPPPLLLGEMDRQARSR